jgi:hypothetical protein
MEANPSCRGFALDRIRVQLASFARWSAITD